MSAVLPNVDTLSICEICKRTWRVSLSINVRTTMIRWVVHLLWIFEMFHGLTNNPNILQPSPAVRITLQWPCTDRSEVTFASCVTLFIFRRSLPPGVSISNYKDDLLHGDRIWTGFLLAGFHTLAKDTHLQYRNIRFRLQTNQHETQVQNDS